MSNKVTLQVILEFSDNVPEEDHQKIAENLQNAISGQIYGGPGMVSDSAEYYTEQITLS